jgi:hypothetical protein
VFSDSLDVKISLQLSNFKVRERSQNREILISNVDLPTSWFKYSPHHNYLSTEGSAAFSRQPVVSVLGRFLNCLKYLF